MLRSKTTARFRKAFKALPATIQRQARAAYQRFRSDPSHPSLRFKPVHKTQPIYSVRVNLNYRALGVKEGEAIIWFWIGDHEDYDELLKRL